MKPILPAVVAVLLGGAAGMAAAEPTAAQIIEAIRSEHPRLFFTRADLPAIRQYAETKARPYREQLLAAVDRLPDRPALEILPEALEMKDGRLIWKKQFNDANFCQYAVRMTGGTEAAQCAMAYLLTGREEYRRKTIACLKLLADFCKWSDQYQTSPDWYYYKRMCGFAAYDWIADTLSPAERRELMAPLLAHVKHMQNPGYSHNSSGGESGNYGDRALAWFAGAATLHDGIDETTARELALAGARNHLEMMKFRETTSGGSGLLASSCVPYSFDTYPWSSYNFLFTLKSAAGIDGTEFWTQMRDYGNYFGWQMIPLADGTFSEFGWADTGHITNRFPAADMYAHIALAIHFYGRNHPDHAARLRALQSLLPEASRNIRAMRLFPFLPFIMTGFDPEVTNPVPANQLLGSELAGFFPTYGTVFMRSGVTPADTYATIKAGALYDGHQHYDENSFIIYKGGHQALDSGTRGVAPHHLVYYPQTVAHNAILIRMPQEPLPKFWYSPDAEPVPADVFCDGGQNATKKARNLIFSASRYHVVAAGDATACYSPQKAREAIRQFVFVAPDYFVIYDRVESVKPDQQKVFVLHTQNEPRKLADGSYLSTAGRGSLGLRTLLPENARTEIIGGPGREFFTNGRNWPMPNHDKILAAPNWAGRYRYEISPADESTATRFLHFLQVAPADEAGPMVPVKLLVDADADGAAFVTREGLKVEIRFSRRGPVGGGIVIRDLENQILLEEPFIAKL